MIFLIKWTDKNTYSNSLNQLNYLTKNRRNKNRLSNAVEHYNNLQKGNDINVIIFTINQSIKNWDYIYNSKKYHLFIISTSLIIYMFGIQAFLPMNKFYSCDGKHLVFIFIFADFYSLKIDCSWFLLGYYLQFNVYLSENWKSSLSTLHLSALSPSFRR